MTRGWDIEFCFWKKMEYADWLVQKNGINGWFKMVGPYADLSFATIFRPWDFGGALFSDKRIRVDHHFSNTAKYIVGIKSQISGFHIHEIRWNPINSYSKFYKVRLFSLHLWIRKIHDFPPPPASMPRRLELGSWSPACGDASKLSPPNKMEWMTLSGPVFFCFVEHFWTEFMCIYI